MAWQSNFRRGTDLPTWDWLSFNPDGTSYPGSCLTWDGVRYMYFISQTGTTTTSSTSASSAQLWRYDTWSDGWQRLSSYVYNSSVSLGSGADIAYDPVRNVLWNLQGAGGNGGSYQMAYGYNLNYFNQLANGNTQVQATALTPYTQIQITQSIATAPSNGSQIEIVEDVSFNDPFATGTVAQGISAQVFLEPLYPSLVNPAHYGCAIRMTAGTAGNIGQRRTIDRVAFSNGVRPVLQTYSSGGAVSTNTVVVGSATGVTVGAFVFGTGISAGTTVTAISGTTLTLSANNTTQVSGTLSFHPFIPQATTFTGNSGSYNITVASATGVGPGMPIAGTGIPVGAVVTNVSGSTVTLNLPLTVTTGTSTACAFFSGGPISVPVTGTNGATTITVTSANFLSVGMSVSGRGISPNAYVIGISGTTVTLSAANVDVVSGAGVFQAQYNIIATSAGFSGTPAYGDTYVVEYPQGTASSASTTTVVDSAQSWITNIYRDSDVVITGGTGAGQRRRIASNTSNTLTLAQTVSSLQATLATSTAVVTLTAGSTAGMTIGQVLTLNSGTGAFGSNAVVQSIQSTTQFTANVNHATAGAVTFTAAYPTGNPRVGAFVVSPDATSTYQIVPSSDILYVTSGNSSTNWYRMDVNTNTSAATGWILGPTLVPGSTGNGSTMMYGKKTGPFSLFVVRGNGNVQIYRYDIGLQTWTQINFGVGQGSNAASGSSDYPSTGATATILYDYNRIAMHYQGSTRLTALRLSDTFVEPLGTIPYAGPSSYEGRRMRYAVSQNGVPWLYFQRAGGGEFFRMALEHL